MANNEKQSNQTNEPIQVVAFKLRNEEYGVNILHVQEIRSLTDITRVPFAQDFIKGVINLRGSVLPVIDLKQRLGLEQTPYTDDTRIVTVNVNDLQVGMLVDAVTEVLTLTSSPSRAASRSACASNFRHSGLMNSITGFGCTSCAAPSPYPRTSNSSSPPCRRMTCNAASSCRT